VNEKNASSRNQNHFAGTRWRARVSPSLTREVPFDRLRALSGSTMFTILSPSKDKRSASKRLAAVQEKGEPTRNPRRRHSDGLRVVSIFEPLKTMSMPRGCWKARRQSESWNDAAGKVGFDWICLDSAFLTQARPHFPPAAPPSP